MGFGSLNPALILIDWRKNNPCIHSGVTDAGNSYSKQYNKTNE
ncbi:MAG: hypothetical protein P8X74_05550 [Reinekea sp.]